MTWQYECTELSEVYEMLNDTTKHPDYDTLKEVAKKAHAVATFFKNNGMNEGLIKNYLDGHLEIDVLSNFALMSNVLYPQDIPDEERNHSYSHMQWLRSLSLAKSSWKWTESSVVFADVQVKTIDALVSSYNELQYLALDVSDASTQTTESVDITYSSDYCPIIEYSITQYMNGGLMTMITCSFDNNDFGTQTEYNVAFDYDIEMHIKGFELNDKYNGIET
jgi:hypothetical protein